ncbi:thioredoxin peroxidase [Schizosaccharomyces cryophilus OY26]|uniref:thioredoxin-dependent peroxiredoxin n=1 Tax=Schizosaccharomyces cryophilus (strain OY26 / ATCC MYA-4695 / CBS 11777 / NBRC 106824 / NRRL Y48691) TaxID=653667 RepID=S9VZN1_SCHCR|nr:thioredoxin peroxidase [Schizosaccharomyces cryophilus OY26]EPY53118.1 thioredoxin peroxidase [Schizosaccharomyces cryophilus OY26]
MSEYTASTPRRSSRLNSKDPSNVQGVAKPEKTETSSDTTASPANELEQSIDVGDLIPDLTLLNQDEVPVKLSELVKSRGLVIFAYPRASTPGCTKQGCGFRDNYPQIQAADYEVFGVSFDSCKSQKSFKTKQEFPYDLLSDPEGLLIERLGARKPDGKLFRSHWIFEKGSGKCLVKEIDISPLDSVDKVFQVVTGSNA